MTLAQLDLLVRGHNRAHSTEPDKTRKGAKSTSGGGLKTFAMLGGA